MTAAYKEVLVSDRLTRREFVGGASGAAVGLAAAAHTRAAATASANVIAPHDRTYKQRLGEIEGRLVTAMESMDVIDAHTHIAPEKSRIDSKVDVVKAFASQMDKALIAAGMSPDDYSKLTGVYTNLFEVDLSLDERWKLLEPYLPLVRHVSMARPMYIAMKEFYDCDDITSKTYGLISERMQEANKAGIYKRVLQDKCRIRWSITMNAVGPDLYSPNPIVSVAGLDYLAGVRTREDVEQRAAAVGEKVNSLGDYITVVRKHMTIWRNDCHVVGIKKLFTPVSGKPDADEATSLFGKLDSNPLPWGATPLSDFITHRMLDMSAELGLVVAVHTGCYGDFMGELDPTSNIPMIANHPQTRFDLYHLGIPHVHAIAVMAWNHPNVWLNLTWAHVVCSSMTVKAMDELLDLLPANKVSVFGADQREDALEKAYGHIVMARENLATVLGKRVRSGLMTEDEALETARLWFLDNPAKLYDLKI